MCAACHGGDGKGRGYPSLTRLTELGDPEVLKTFLNNVPPPMPVLYPGVLNDDEVGMIAQYMKTSSHQDQRSDFRLRSAQIWRVTGMASDLLRHDFSALHQLP